MRAADQTDIPELLRVGAAIAAEAKPPAPFDEAVRRKWLSALLAQPNVMCVVEGDDLGLEGVVLGACIREDGIIEARVEYIWVHPEKRHSRLCVYLMRVFEDWSRSMGAKVLWFSSTTGHSLEALARLVGAEEVGRNYRKSLRNGDH